MPTLKCNSCQGNIPSNARRVQCPHCGELFPFACAHCNRKLRPPFSVFDDERYLNLDSPPQPLCDDHYLRQCPDCQNWFGADENPGFFRCKGCAEIHQQNRAQQPPEVFAPAPSDVEVEGGVATRAAPAGARAQKSNGNALVIAFAVCAFVALLGWLIFNR